MHTGVDINFFLHRPQRRVLGRIKSSPEDFEVREVYFESVNGLDSGTMGPLTVADCLDFCVPAPLESKHEFETANHLACPIVDRCEVDPKAEKVHDAFDFTRWLDERTLTDLLFLNSWMDRETAVSIPSTDINGGSSCKDEGFEIWVPADRTQRKKLYTVLEDRFPFLSFSLNSLHSAPQEVSETKTACSLNVLCDRTMFSELNPFLPLEDIKTLYSFKKSGPQNPRAQDGVLIGRDISREGRGEVYRRITGMCKSFDSKTVEVERGEGSKAMLVYWRPRALSAGAGARHQIQGGGVGRKRGREGEAAARGTCTLYIWFTLLKRNVEQLDAAKRIIAAVGDNSISLSDMHVAGLKDKRAVSYQRCSLCIRDRGPGRSSEEKARRICTALLGIRNSWDWRGEGGRGVACSDLRLSHSPISLGQLWGNKFRIIVRSIRILSEDSESSSSAEVISILAESLSMIKVSGFPNFFGSQRMGIVFDRQDDMDQCRGEWGLGGDKGLELPVGARVGRLLLLGRYSEAIDSIILGDCTSRSTGVRATTGGSALDNARAMYAAGGALPVVISLFPMTSTRERLLLRGLIRFGRTDPLRVLRLMPVSALTLYVSALQSFVFNKTCTYRLQQNASAPIAGDLILDAAGELKILSEEEVSVQVAKGSGLEVMSHVVLPMFGRRTRSPENSTGEFYMRCLAEYGLPVITSGADAGPEETETDLGEIEDEDRVVADRLLHTSSDVGAFYPKGAYRRVLYVSSDAAMRPIADDARDVTIEFSLPSGSYATAFLRELTGENSFL